MLARLSMELKSEKIISIYSGSLFHGAIMELLPKDYANVLHYPALKPYTIHLEKIQGIDYLICTTTNREAYEFLIENLLLKLDTIFIKYHDQEIELLNKKLFIQDREEMVRGFYDKEYSKIIEVEFVTPTAFKQKGEFVFFPDLRLIYQSLMNKYDAANEEESALDTDVLESLIEHTKIIAYSLKSESFHLEGVKIPAFKGRLKLKISSNQTMTNFANMLFEFGKYSGIGVKCALGMGAINIKMGGMKIGTSD